MRTCNSDTKRLGCVEPSATNEGDCSPRRFEHVGKTVFCGKANRSKKVQGEPVAEEGMEEEAPNSEVNVSGRASGKKGGGSVGSWKLN